MELDRYVTLLRGGVLRSDGESAIDLNSLLAAFANCKRLAEDRRMPKAEWDAVRRKLTLCVMLNCRDLVQTQMQNTDLYRSFVDLFRLDLPVLMEAVSRLDLWPFIVEAMPLVSRSAVCQLLDASLAAIPQDPVVHLAVTVAAVLEYRRDGTNDSENLAKSILAFVTKLDLSGVAGRSPADLGTAMLHLLTCVRALLGEDDPAAVLASDSGVKRQYYPEEMSTLQKYVLRSDCLLVQSLLAQLAQVSSVLTVDVWVELVDVDTAKLMSNGLVRFWEADLVAPSNVQLLIAHYAFECLELLARLKVDGGQVVPMLAPLAKRYDKHIELGLSDLTDDGFVAVAMNASGWKLNAYLSSLIEDRADLVVTSSEAMACVRKHAQAASEFVDALYKKTVNVKKVSPAQAETLVCVLGRCQKAKLEGLLKAHVDAFGVEAESRLRGPNFEAELRQFSNMLVRQEEEDGLVGEKQALLLALQDPLRLLQQLLDDAAESTDKARAIVRIFGVLDCVLLHCDREGVSVLSRVVQERVSAVHSNREESVSSTIANFSRLFHGLAKNSRLMWGELADVFVSGLHSERSVSALAQLIALFHEAILAQESFDDTEYSEQVVIRLLCHHIGRLQFEMSHGACFASALDLMTAIADKHRELRNFAGLVLPHNLRGHVMNLSDCCSLEDLTHAVFSSKSPDVSLCEAMAMEQSLPEVLSRLLPREWDLLLMCGKSDCIERVVNAANVLAMVCQGESDDEMQLYAELLGGALARTVCLAATPLPAHQSVAILKHLALLQLRHPTSSSLQVFVGSVANAVLDKSNGAEETLGQLLPVLYALPPFQAKTLLVQKIELAAQ